MDEPAHGPHFDVDGGEEIECCLWTLGAYALLAVAAVLLLWGLYSWLSGML